MNALGDSAQPESGTQSDLPRDGTTETADKTTGDPTTKYTDTATKQVRVPAGDLLPSGLDDDATWLTTPRTALMHRAAVRQNT